MAFIWIQVWGPLPTFHEVIKEDVPLGSQPALRPSKMAHPNRPESSQSLSTGNYDEGVEARKEQPGRQLPTTHIPTQSFASQQYATQTTRGENYNMNALGTALPDLSYQNYMPLQRNPSGSAGVLYPVPTGQQYATAQTFSTPTNSQYNMNYQAQYPGVYNLGHSASVPQISSGTPATSNQFYHNQTFIGQQQQQQQSPPYFVQPNQYNRHNQMYSPIPSVQYASPASFSSDTRFHTQHRDGDYLGAGGGFPSGGAVWSGSTASGIGQSSVAREPPRKPRQSGHAIWIGNLPPQTELMNLVLHVCKEAPGLESLFLISKSNCAFANFKDEEACNAAQAKIHESHFQTVRLVSRLRRSSAITTTSAAVPTGPAALSPPNPPLARTPSPAQDLKLKQGDGGVDPIPVADGEDKHLPEDKFFVVKSLTVEDLELSVRNGIWATQSHNEDSLNQAFKSANNVYLIFSANKSGEYFGYARMTSSINDDFATAIEVAPKAQAGEDPELIKVIPTPANEFTPKGRIIDDSARGTIFWEAEREDEEEEDKESNKSDPSEAPPSKAWGKPFKIEWVSTTRLPFYRTRGLRNPWNSNREVKIARDGTELETSIGKRLLSLFHHLPSPVVQLMPGQLLGYRDVRQFP